MAILTDIVFIIDESGSMSNAQAWITSYVVELDEDLVAAGIDPRYAIVGQGATAHGSTAYSPHKHLIDGQDFSSDASVVQSAMAAQLVTSGSYTDMYPCIDYALDQTLSGAQYAWRSGALKAFILVQDTSREGNDATTDAYILDLLRDNNVLTAWFVDMDLYNVEGEQSLGGNYDLVSYHEDGSGGFLTGVWDVDALIPTNDPRSAINSYIPMAFATQGSVWDIGELTGVVSPLTISSFAATFSALFSEEIITVASGSGCSDVPSTAIPFYCPSSEQSVESVIRFTQTNPLSEYDEELNLHFRVTFYSDETRERVVYSSFSLVDDKRWYISGSTYEAMTDSGSTIESGESVEIIYVPDIYPQQLFRLQHVFSLESNNIESPLLSGVRYYTTIESYDTASGDLTLISNGEFKLNASDVETNFWRENLDNKNWVSSAQGQDDLLVSNSGKQSVFPSISSNIFGLFYIANQSLRNGSSTITRSFWEADKDRLYGSGQGLRETVGPFNGQKPQTITDIGQNFYIDSVDDSNIYVSNCALPEEDTIDADPSTIIQEGEEVICIPGTSKVIGSEFYIRVSEQDESGSFVINKDEAISVVEKTDINLDISGVYGAYKVRFRNQNGNWQPWKDIDNNNFIENNRFVVPWEIPRVNGIRSICCQVLTISGMTEVKCIDVFVNMPVVDYFVDYYSDAGLTEEVPAKEGFSFLATKGEEVAQIYVRITFSEPQTYATKELKFDVIHQGISNVFDEELEAEGTSSPYSTYKGSFTIGKEDGIYDVDGTGFLKVKFPDIDEPIDNCVSDRRDLYNQMLIKSKLEFLDTVEQTPEEAFKENITKTPLKVLDVNEFKQYYDSDDPNFLFGDAGFYRN